MQSKSIFMPQNMEIQDAFKKYEQKAYENNLIQRDQRRNVIQSNIMEQKD